MLNVPLDILPSLHARTHQADHRRHLQLVGAQKSGDFCDLKKYFSDKTELNDEMFNLIPTKICRSEGRYFELKTRSLSPCPNLDSFIRKKTQINK